LPVGKQNPISFDETCDIMHSASILSDTVSIVVREIEMQTVPYP
jgi:hypothetical protein